MKTQCYHCGTCGMGMGYIGSCGRLDRFCTNCGGTPAKNPTCNWCAEDMGPPETLEYGRYTAKKYCKGCGRSRHDALHTHQPKKPSVWGRIKKWFHELSNHKIIELLKGD